MMKEEIFQYYRQQVYQNIINGQNIQFSHEVYQQIDNSLLNCIESALSNNKYHGQIETMFFTPKKRPNIIHPVLLDLYLKTNNLSFETGWKNHLKQQNCETNFSKWLINNRKKLIQKFSSKKEHPFMKALNGIKSVNDQYGINFEHFFAELLNLNAQEYEKLTINAKNTLLKKMDKYFSNQKKLQVILNRATKSTKISPCVVGVSDKKHYKTDCWYRNKNRAFTRISLKTHRRKYIQIGQISLPKFIIKYGKNQQLDKQILQKNLIDILTEFFIGTERENLKWLVSYNINSNKLKIFYYQSLIKLFNKVTIHSRNDKIFDLNIGGECFGYINLTDKNVKLHLYIHNQNLFKPEAIIDNFI